MSVSSVKIYINMALEYLDSPYRVDDVEPNLIQAEQRLANLPPADAAPLVAQITEIRAKLDNLVKPADARQVSAAQGKIRQVRNYIETNGGRLTQSDKDHVEELFRGAVQFLAQITDARKADSLKAPVLAEITEIRAQYQTDNTAPPPSLDFHNAKRAVFWANEYFNSPGRIDQVEPELAKAESMLKGDNSAEAAGLMAEITEVREKLANIVSSQDKGYVSAAEGKLRQIRDHVERNGGRVYGSDKEYFEELCRGSIEFLDKITHPRKANELKAPVLAEISRLRTLYGFTDTGALAGAVSPPPMSTAPPLPSPHFDNAKRKVFAANNYFTTPGRIEQTEPELAQAEQLLDSDASREANTLRAEIAALREKLADIVMPSEEAHVRSAKREVQSVRDYVNQQREFLGRGDTKQHLDQRLQKIIDESLTKINHPRMATQLKAPILAEIALIRSELGVTTPTFSPQPSPTATLAQARSQVRSGPQPTPNFGMDALSFEDQDRLSRAKRTIAHARSNIESRRTEGVENLFFDAASLMAPISDTNKAHLVAEIEQLRRELEATRLAEDTRIITGELDRKLCDVEAESETPGSDRLQYSVRSFKQRFEREDVGRILTPEMYRSYETRLANALAAGAALVKAKTLERANPALKRLQDKLATNPFTGLQQYDANRVDGELRSMRWQVEREIQQLPENDVDRLRIYEELKATDAKFEAHSNEWAKAGIHESVRSGWQMVRNEFEGWEQESLRPDAQPLEDPNMPQTRLGIHRVHHYLHGDTYVQRTRDENPGDLVIAAIDHEAEQLLEAVGTKMASAFNHIMDVAEKLETPIEDRWLREKPGYLITNARGTFEDTIFGEPVLARIRALDQRWKDELAGVHTSREILGEKLSFEASQKWPSIVAAIPTVSGFDPSSAKPGDAVHLNGVYNRAGWDFDGNQYSFSMRFNGVPLGGIYEAYINKALDHAVYELKLRVDDHEKWDLVGVVLGPGSISERTKRTIRRGMDTETIEEWLPIGCLRLRIIALRAGPVVVGPHT
ncbi:hypothetical protein B0H67DRAFT_558768 [Lasiosphaeris hirsuta]|uniref:Uncharacterized protein n=1 Tax=Lasiosphaeris hirsuta TaxID=260670 RepID=A0AA40DHS2_9PEZI|nr:hypothetical protein B0H67DRAFT_558768 [Lasiosphaeris hirsuta]